MYLVILLILFLVFYPFSYRHFFSPSHPDIFFLFAHSSPSHFFTNFISVFLLWFISRKLKLNQKRLFIVFFVTSFSSLFLSYLFDLPVIGSSVGIYGMTGFILPELSIIVSPAISYTVLFLAILLAPSLIPWGKVFHIFGFSFGVIARYFLDYRTISYLAALRSMGYDYYSVRGTAYLPGSYMIEYKREKE